MEKGNIIGVASCEALGACPTIFFTLKHHKIVRLPLQTYLYSATLAAVVQAAVA